MLGKSKIKWKMYYLTTGQFTYHPNLLFLNCMIRNKEQKWPKRFKHNFSNFIYCNLCSGCPSFDIHLFSKTRNLWLALDNLPAFTCGCPTLQTVQQKQSSCLVEANRYSANRAVGVRCLTENTVVMNMLVKYSEAYWRGRERGVVYRAGSALRLSLSPAGWWKAWLPLWTNGQERGTYLYILIK